jgi:predicted CoA-substrate-specific enzyme activase
MKAVGLDIGSLTTKVVVLDGDKIASSVIVASGEDAESTARDAVKRALAGADTDFNEDTYIVSTGIGGKSISFGNQQKSITTCLARGISGLFPSARILIDMGAESITIVKLNERGRLVDWLGHDKCAAGTGIFLQQMAKLMQLPLPEMARLSLQANNPAEITSTCAVFAESEVISHVHRNPPTPKEDIVAGIYSSLVSRVMALIKRVGVEKDVAVSGGVALNIGLVKTLEKELGYQVLVPEIPQIAAALGAAKIAAVNSGGA